MKTIAAICLLALTWSCNSNPSSADATAAASKLPAKPGSIETVQAGLKGKNFKTVNAGTMSPFEMDKNNPYEWQDKITDTFTKKNLADQMSFSLNFLNDTAVTIFDDGKEKQGAWKVDTITNGDEPTGVKLRVSHMDLGFGSNDSMKVTYTYPISGMNDKQLLLLTSRDINNRKVVVLMEAK